MPSGIDTPDVTNASAQIHSILLEDKVDLLSMAIPIAKYWRGIGLVTGIFFLLGVAVSLLMAPTYLAMVTILPPQQATSSAASVLGQLGSIAGMAGGSIGLGLKSPADMYIGILESRTIADQLISRFNLKKLYGTRTFVDTRVALAQHVTFESGKDGLIHLSFKDTNPQRASDLANGYLDELYRMNAQLVTGEAAQRRSFYDQRLAEEKAALAVAEDSLRNTEQKTGVIQLSGQASSIINAIAQARAELASREVELQSMQTFATAQNPDTIRLQEEITALRAHVTDLENSQRRTQPGDVELPAGQVPQAALEYSRQTREVKYHETLFDLLSRQSEAARLDEAKSAPILQVIDRAVPPDKKSGPPRKLIAIGFAVFGFLAACAWSLVKAALARMQQDPVQARKLADLRAALRR